MAKPKLKRLSRFVLWLRRLFEMWLGRYYEGPEPPRRLGQELQVWLRLYPDAPREAIEGYVVLLLESAYREGFVRGYEWQERGWPGPAVDPELLAEMEAEDWSLADHNPRVRRILEDGHDPMDPLANVAAPDKRAFIDMLARQQNIRVLPEPIQYEDDDVPTRG